jgi:exopolysaccharide biosynthesis polyprenyl glycosylphosphotransferase
MQFEATTWESPRAIGPAPSSSELATAPAAAGDVELTGTAVPRQRFVHAGGRRREGAWHRLQAWLRGEVGSGEAVAAVPPLLDSVCLAGCLSVLRFWTVGGAVWALATFLLLRDTASAQPHRRINAGAFNDLPALATRLCPSLLLLLALAAISGRTLPVAGLVSLPVMVLAGRAMACAAVRRCRVHLGMLEPTVIIGTGCTSLQLADALCEYPAYGSQPIGFLDSSEPEDLPLPHLGHPADIESVVQSLDVRRVIVAGAQERDSELVDVIRGCTGLDAEVYVVPRFFELNVAGGGGATEQVRGIPLLHLPRRALRSASWPAKRAVDAVVASLLLLLLSPVMLAVALGVRAGSPGPVLFRQRRVGVDGSHFELLKFRTMRLNDDSETTWSVRHDARVTRLGRWLRRSGLDELPQLINVLRGEMSLVGPRPERPYFVERFSAVIPGYRRRLRVPPGITGWAQVHGLRGDTSVPERVRFDNHYVENWSLWRDLAILLRTLLVGMKSGHS